MSLLKSTLKGSFKEALLAETPNPTLPQKQSAERIAEKMSDAVNKFVRTATVVSVMNSSGTITSTLIT